MDGSQCDDAFGSGIGLGWDGFTYINGFFVPLILSPSICRSQERWGNSPEKSHFPRVFMVIGEVTSGATTLSMFHEGGTAKDMSLYFYSNQLRTTC